FPGSAVGLFDILDRHQFKGAIPQHDSTGLIGPSQRRNDRGIEFGVTPPASCLFGLYTAGIVEQDVSVALVATLRVPICFTMAEKHECLHLWDVTYSL